MPRASPCQCLEGVYILLNLLHVAETCWNFRGNDLIPETSWNTKFRHAKHPSPPSPSTNVRVWPQGANPWFLLVRHCSWIENPRKKSTSLQSKRCCYQKNPCPRAILQQTSSSSSRVVYKFTTHLSITCTLQSAGPTSRILANLAMPGNAHPNFQWTSTGNPSINIGCSIHSRVCLPEGDQKWIGLKTMYLNIAFVVTYPIIRQTH